MFDFFRLYSGTYNWVFIAAIGVWIASSCALAATWHKHMTDKASARAAALENAGLRAEIAKLKADTQTKPLKERVREFLVKLDPLLPEAIRGGRHQFQRQLTFAQAAELQSLDVEDVSHTLIQIMPSTNMIMNAPGKAGEFIFRVGKGVFE